MFQDKLAPLFGRFRGDFLVCGLGPSLKLLRHDHGCYTIGVNDIGKYFDPDFLLLIDRPCTFGKDRLKFIWHTEPTFDTIVANNFLPEWKEHLLRDFIDCPLTSFSQNKAPGPWFDVRAQLHHYGSSTLTGLSLAGFLGARRIGLIGVDFVNHPRIKNDSVEDWDKHAYPVLADWLKARQVEVYNLSPVSKLESIPRMDLEEWYVAHRRH